MNEQDQVERSAKLEELRQTIQVGLDQIERGEVVPLDIDKIRDIGMATREKLLEKLQVGLDQAERGEVSKLTLAEIQAEARGEWEACRKAD